MTGFWIRLSNWSALVFLKVQLGKRVGVVVSNSTITINSFEFWKKDSFQCLRCALCWIWNNEWLTHELISCHWSLFIPPESQRFFDIFRGYKKKPVAWNGEKTLYRAQWIDLYGSSIGWFLFDDNVGLSWVLIGVWQHPIIIWPCDSSINKRKWKKQKTKKKSKIVCFLLCSVLLIRNPVLFFPEVTMGKRQLKKRIRI